ncbi:MAG: YbaK/EbsC family protein [Nanoarchaeota archaeon]|nr:YbaK/EbsC family protein [Nanoarchaeota archaeon]
MINEEEKLKNYIKEHDIKAEHLHFNKTLHTVQDTLNVTGFPIELITKSMIFKDKTDRTIVGMAPAEFRVSQSGLSKVLGVEVSFCSVEESYERTGYPIGGMPCFGYDAIVIMDPKILENKYIYTGGGSEFSLVKISVDEIKRLIKPIIKGRIRGNKSN